MKKIATCCLLFYFFNVNAQSSFTVLFDFNRYDLTIDARARLDSFISANEKEIGDLSFQLHGHCDAIGSFEYNDKLSRRRVATVKKYFTEKGINPQHIGDEIGHGKKLPLNENRSDEERQLNRRVEISFSKMAEGSLIDKIADTTTIAGTNIVLRNINFVGGRHVFLEEASPMLDELLNAMKKFPALVIRVEGHICCEPGDDDGVDLDTGIKNLSEARAKAVQDFLINNGIDPNRISHKGFGHSAPLHPYPEKTIREQTENRRVEIKILKK